MRTIKFLACCLGLTFAAPVLAQGGLQPGAFPRVDRFARVQAQRLERRKLMRHSAAARFVRLRSAERFRGHAALRAGFRPGLRVGMRAGIRPRMRAEFRAGERAGFRAGARAGLRAGARASFRPGLRRGARANATPELKAFREQLSAQRQSIRAQVLDGKLTREQAHTQLRSWITEHRPKK